MIVFAKDPVNFNNVMAESIRVEIESNTKKNVKSELIYEEGYKFGVKAFGPRNYAKVKYQIQVDGEESFLIDPDVDLRIWQGESVYNYRLLFTPAEERDKGFVNKLFFSPEDKDLQNSKSKKYLKLSDEPTLSMKVFKRIMSQIPSGDLRIYSDGDAPL